MSEEKQKEQEESGEQPEAAEEPSTPTEELAVDLYPLVGLSLAAQKSKIQP